MRAASIASAAGTKTVFTFLSAARATIGRMPLVCRTLPSRDSSPRKRLSPVCSSAGICPEAVSIPMAIGRSYEGPSLRKSAGARLTVMRLNGKRQPEFLIAERTRSLDSLTAVSGRPTIVKAARPLEISISTSTSAPSRPITAQLCTFASINNFPPQRISLIMPEFCKKYKSPAEFFKKRSFIHQIGVAEKPGERPSQQRRIRLEGGSDHLADHGNEASRNATIPPPSPIAKTSHLSGQLRRIFQIPGKGLQEGSGGSTIDSAVIEGQAQCHHLSPLAFLRDAHKLLVQASNTKNGNFRRVDDGRKSVNAVHTQIGHAECAARDLFTRKGSFTRTPGQLPRLLRDFLQSLAVCITHHRHNQTLIQSNRYPDINSLLQPDMLPFNTGIEPGMLFEGKGYCLDDKVGVGQGKLLYQHLAQPHQSGDIHLADQRHLGRGLHTLLHTPGNSPTHPRQRNDLPG